ncbi:PhzF family phenazine biosynthesis isomerase [Streptomyces orinoci]|uniref:PhzF family phenazine biosynthesis isomerase n=1 Tax=Streptomyces orinoci TaxID=67339 RepID=A0ABV3JU57_STRON|nr:PhzF family phenazine biosynthesis isomerase [Streptomyces orinoci]
MNPTPEARTPEVLHYAAFTTTPTGGNPAGVVLDAQALDEQRMLAIAAETGYSETAFLTTADTAQRRFTIRYFSPLAEVDFCGHATIATAVALAERIGPGELLFGTRAGDIRVDTATDDHGAVHATLTSVPAHSRPASPDEVVTALDALHWDRADLDPALPPHIAFAGNDHLVLAAASRARLADLHYDFDALGAVMRAAGWTTVHLVWRESEHRFHARDPFPIGGVVEDPATGAAAAAFGGYLRTLGLIRTATTLTIRQGEDLGRPSDLTVRIDPDDARIRVSGRAVRMAA